MAKENIIVNSDKIEPSSSIEHIVSNQEEETIIYQPYEHVIIRRVSNYERPEELPEIQIEVPEGYVVLSTQPSAEEKYILKRTDGFYVWYINTKPVKAKLVYNEILDCYDCSQPGVVIEQELENEEESPTFRR